MTFGSIYRETPIAVDGIEAGIAPRRASNLAADPFAPEWRGATTPPPLDQQPADHPAFYRLMQRIPPHVRATLTREQIVAISKASVPQNSPHLVDYRVSLPFFGKRFYVTLLAGRERRSRARLAREGQLLSVETWEMSATLATALAAMAIGGAIMVLYLYKAAIGADFILSGPAPSSAYSRPLQR